MRRQLALSVVVASAVLVFALALAFAKFQNGLAAGDHQLVRERGREVYAEQRCRACHSIAGVGNTRYPLDHVGRDLSTDVIRKWIVAPRTLNPTVRKPEFDLSESDLEALILYLTTLVGDPVD